MMGDIFIVVALVSFIITWGFLEGKSWARLLELAFAALDALYEILTLPEGALSVIIAVIMISYLIRPAVIEWFAPTQVSMKIPST